MTLWLPKRSYLVFYFLAVISFGCASAPGSRDANSAPPRRPTIVFMTDFGTANDAVAICKAVILGIAPDARIMDITHQVTPYQIEEASRFLYSVTPYYPSGTRPPGPPDPSPGRDVPEFQIGPHGTDRLSVR